MGSNIFVIGLDDLNEAVLHRLPDAEQYVFHQLLTLDELRDQSTSFPELLTAARQQLDAFDGRIDTIVGYWDFPTCMMVPILCEEYGFPAASLRSVVACEHKYWSRLEQQKVITEIPAFGILDESADTPQLPEGTQFPVWIKPVKSVSSEGAFYVADEDALVICLNLMQQANERIATPFEDVLAMLDLPSEIAEAGAASCIVEEPAKGHQFTVEGVVRPDDVHVYGIVDSVNFPGSSSFLRYQYPSGLPEDVLARATAVTERVVPAMGLENTTFNVEYFWDPETDLLRLLEINVRHSQSHALLFDKVDGVANHIHMLDIGLGRPFRPVRGHGEVAMAAKWFLRHFADGVVHRAPTEEEVKALEEAYPGTVIKLEAQAGDRLGNSIGEDSYSYVLAQIFTGGSDEEELQAIYDACVDGLHFEIDKVPADEA